MRLVPGNYPAPSSSNLDRNCRPPFPLAYLLLIQIRRPQRRPRGGREQKQHRKHRHELQQQRHHPKPRVLPLPFPHERLLLRAREAEELEVAVVLEGAGTPAKD